MTDIAGFGLTAEPDGYVAFIAKLINEKEERMTTDELIQALRDVADECEDLERIKLCNEAADRLEELDERVAIMMEGKDDG